MISPDLAEQRLRAEWLDRSGDALDCHPAIAHHFVRFEQLGGLKIDMILGAWDQEAALPIQDDLLELR